MERTIAWLGNFRRLVVRYDRSLTIYRLENYIFCREWPKIDETRPMGRGGWRTAWRSLREASAKEDREAGLEAMPRLANLRYYDLRHQFITELCEAGQPEAVIRELGGTLTWK